MMLDIKKIKLKPEEEIISAWKKKDKIVVSCCAISFNHEKYIEKALVSMLMQETDFAFEIIIRDDASTDNTQNIIKQYVQKYPTLIKPILEEENGFIKGVKARRVVMALAKGTFLAPLDCDDYWTRTDKLQQQVDFLLQNQEYSHCYHDAIVVNESDTVMSDSRLPDAKDLSSDDLIIGLSTVLPSFAVFKNIEFKFNDVFDDIKNGDTVLWHLLGFEGRSKYIPNFTAGAFRIHSQGVNSGLSHFNKAKNRINTRVAICKNLHDKGEYILEQKCKGQLRAYCVNYLSSLFISFQFIDLAKTAKYFPKIFGLDYSLMILEAIKQGVLRKLKKLRK